MIDMRRFLEIAAVVAISILGDYCILFMSTAVDALPPAHYAGWMKLLEGRCANGLQLQVIDAAVQWYGGPIVVGLVSTVVAFVARMVGTGWRSIIAGATLFAVAMGILRGSFDAPSVFSLFFAVMCAAGGAAVSEKIQDKRRNTIPSPFSET